MPKQGTPCGQQVEADTQPELGTAYSQHLNGCSACQQKMAALRDEFFGPNDSDPRD